MASAFLCEESPRTLDCIVCGKAVISTQRVRDERRRGRRQIICSDECRRQRQNAHNRRYTAEGRYKDRQRARCPRFKKFNCERCGDQFTSQQSKASYCKPCRPAAIAATLRAKCTTPLNVCAHCGTRFRYHATARSKGLYCSKACTNEAKRQTWPQTRVWPIACGGCGSFFVARNGSRRLCNPDCGAQPTMPSKRACSECYAAIAGRWVRRCEECRAKSHKESVKLARKRRRQVDKKSGRKAAERKARKLRQRGVTVETVNPVKVFDRDKWICQLCGTKTPRRLRGKNQPNSPELDHIVPLAAGGEHSYRNTQCACRSCNISKSSRPLGQMRLFG